MDYLSNGIPGIPQAAAGVSSAVARQAASEPNPSAGPWEFLYGMGNTNQLGTPGYLARKFKIPTPQTSTLPAMAGDVVGAMGLPADIYESAAGALAARAPELISKFIPKPILDRMSKFAGSTFGRLVTPIAGRAVQNAGAGAVTGAAFTPSTGGFLNPQQRLQNATIGAELAGATGAGLGTIEGIKGAWETVDPEQFVKMQQQLADETVIKSDELKSKIQTLQDQINQENKSATAGVTQKLETAKGEYVSKSSQAASDLQQAQHEETLALRGESYYQAKKAAGDAYMDVIDKGIESTNNSVTFNPQKMVEYVRAEFPNDLYGQQKTLTELIGNAKTAEQLLSSDYADVSRISGPSGAAGNIQRLSAEEQTAYINKLMEDPANREALSKMETPAIQKLKDMSARDIFNRMHQVGSGKAPTSSSYDSGDYYKDRAKSILGQMLEDSGVTGLKTANASYARWKQIQKDWISTFHPQDLLGTHTESGGKLITEAIKTQQPGQLNLIKSISERAGVPVGQKVGSALEQQSNIESNWAAQEKSLQDEMDSLKSAYAKKTDEIKLNLSRGQADIASVNQQQARHIQELMAQANQKRYWFNLAKRLAFWTTIGAGARQGVKTLEKAVGQVGQ